MRVAVRCFNCGHTTSAEVKSPETAKEERERIIKILSEHPMGIGGGTLSGVDVAYLLRGLLEP